MRCVVTGGAGFIGSHIADTLLAQGDHVVVLDDLATGHRDNVPAGATFLEGSITDAKTLDQACADADVVFHQGALGSVPRSVEDPRRSHDVNLTGTLQVLEAARRHDVNKVVFAASSSAYGDTETLPKHEAIVPNPKSPYAVTKLAAEAYCAAYWDTYGLATVALRYFNVYGPRQDPNGPYAAVIPRFILAAMAGDTLTINGDGTFSRDFTYVSDVVAANLQAAVAPDKANGKVMNIGAGGRTTIQVLAETIIDRVGNAKASIVHGPERAGDVAHSQASIDRARELIRYAPKVDIGDGLGRTVAWFVERDS